MRVIFILLILAATALQAQTDPTEFGRFRILTVEMTKSSPVVIKIDTQTGETWRLVMSSDNIEKATGQLLFWAKLYDGEALQAYIKANQQAP